MLSQYSIEENSIEENSIDKERGSRGEPQEPTCVSEDKTAKASKHKYGEYKNVLLKDEELQSLQNDYENWEELIKFLDEYIEMKGYKAKSHYLCIRKWVAQAVKEQHRKQGDVVQEEVNDAYELVRKQLEKEGKLNDF